MLNIVVIFSKNRKKFQNVCIVLKVFCRYVYYLYDKTEGQFPDTYYCQREYFWPKRLILAHMKNKYLMKQNFRRFKVGFSKMRKKFFSKVLCVSHIFLHVYGSILKNLSLLKL